MSKALKYQEEYKLALESFDTATLLDPMWEMPREKQKILLQYLDNVQKSINTKGCMKPKKLMQMIQVCLIFYFKIAIYLFVFFFFLFYRLFLF